MWKIQIKVIWKLYNFFKNEIYVESHFLFHDVVWRFFILKKCKNKHIDGATMTLRSVFGKEPYKAPSIRRKTNCNAERRSKGANRAKSQLLLPSRCSCSLIQKRKTSKKTELASITRYAWCKCCLKISLLLSWLLAAEAHSSK